MVNPVRRWAEKYLAEDEGNASASKSQSGASQVYDFVAFQRRFAELLTQRSDMPMGRINIVSLAELKEQLGERWERLEGQIHQAADRIIASHVTRRDIVAPYSPLEYLIVISNATPEAAQLKCASITMEIYRRFLGQEAVSDVNIRSAIEHDGSELIFEDVSMSRLREAAVEAAERAVAVAAQAAEKDAASSVKMVSADEDGIEWPEIPEFFFSEEDEEQAESGDGPPKAISFDPSTLEFIYRPVWDIKREVMSTYFCLPCRLLANGEIAYRYDVLGKRQTEEARAWIDVMAAREALVMLDELLRNKFNMFISTSVHFETLASARLRAKVLTMFNAVPQSMRQFLTVEVVGIPKGVTSGRMSQILSYLRPLCRATFARLELDTTSLQNFEGIGLQAVGVDIRGDKRPEAEIIADLNEFAERVAGLRMLSYCLGVGSTSLAIAAGGAGFHMISGDRIASDQSAPNNILRYNWRDFYVHHDL